MTTVVLRVVPPRPDLAMTRSDEERDLVGRHPEHWGSRTEAGQVVGFASVADDIGSGGLCVAEVDEKAELRAFTAEDPAVLSGR